MIGWNKIHRKGRQICRGAIIRTWNLRYPNGYSKGYDFQNSNWDICIVLDACKYDLFENASGDMWNQHLSRTYSQVSATRELLSHCIDGVDFSDTVYVTANPQLRKQMDEIDCSFAVVDDVWVDRWDEQQKTVPADAVTERALQQVSKEEDWRLLIYYLRPHYPFIDSNAEWDKQGHIKEGGSMWSAIFQGDLSIEQEMIWDLYGSNIKHVLKSVQDLIKYVDGQDVITSDHGHMIGECGCPILILEWGHPKRMYEEPLVAVLWVEFETSASSKPSIKQTRKAGTGHPNVEEKLAALGNVDK